MVRSQVRRGRPGRLRSSQGHARDDDDDDDDIVSDVANLQR